MRSSKKGISAHQLHQMLSITYKTAWFLTHRIRFAMNDEIESAEKLNGIIEVDETYVVGKGKGKRGGRGSVKKIRYLCLLGVSGLLLWTRLQQRT